MTLTDYLNNILKSQTLDENSEELKRLRAHRQDVEAVLRSAFSESAPTIRYGGSIAKKTLIKDAYDLDIICYVEHDDDGAVERPPFRADRRHSVRA
jgi:tRNA nucleotidyltransferase (CCA-adding enzyme)